MTSTNTIVAWKDPLPGVAHKPHAAYWVRGSEIKGPNWLGDDRPLDFQLHGLDPMDWLKERYREEPNMHFAWAERDVGQYHPRFYQGGYYLRDYSVLDDSTSPEHDVASASVEQVDILTEGLANACRVAAPDNATDGIYGSEIRNLLILACTEVEAQLKGILKINGYPKKDDALNMGDYARVAGPMKLDQYGVRLTSFRKYAEVRPFSGWSTGVRLPWYQSYNATKHDREAKFEVATLKDAILAIGALEVLLAAEYGPGIDRASRFLTVVRRPEWDPPEYTYAHPLYADRWEAAPYDFAK